MLPGQEGKNKLKIPTQWMWKEFGGLKGIKVIGKKNITGIGHCLWGGEGKPITQWFGNTIRVETAGQLRLTEHFTMKQDFSIKYPIYLWWDSPQPRAVYWQKWINSQPFLCEQYPVWVAGGDPAGLWPAAVRDGLGWIQAELKDAVGQKYPLNHRSLVSLTLHCNLPACGQGREHTLLFLDSFHPCSFTESKHKSLSLSPCFFFFFFLSLAHSSFLKYHF